MVHRPQHNIKIRRGKRTDIPAVRTLLTPAVNQDTTKQETRYWRRLAADPALDFYVAEHVGMSTDMSPGIIQAVVLVCYIRRLDYRGWCAVLDFAVSTSAGQEEQGERDELGQALIDFAKTRAGKRGCRQMLMYPSDSDSPQKRELLTKNGFQPAGTLFSCALS